MNSVQPFIPVFHKNKTNRSTSYWDYCVWWAYHHLTLESCLAVFSAMGNNQFCIWNYEVLLPFTLMNKAFYAVLLKWLEPGEFKEMVEKRITAEERAQKCLLMNKLKDLHYWKISWLIMKQRRQRALCVICLKMDLLHPVLCKRWEVRV